MLILSSLAHSGGCLAILGHSGLLHAHSETLWLILGDLWQFRAPMLILGLLGSFWNIHGHSVLPMLILDIPNSF